MKYSDVSSPASANGAATATSSRNHRIMICPACDHAAPPSLKRYVSTRGNQDFNRLERRASGGHREGRTPQSSIRSRDAGLPQLQQKTRANGSRPTVSPPQSPVLTALWTTHIICPLDGVHSSHATRLYTPRHRERAAHRANPIWSVNQHPPRVTCFPSPPRTPRPSREEHTLWHLLRGQRILCLALPSARGDSEWRDVHIPCARGGAL